ncbi:energy transducer TonB [Burkholderia cepacia]|nr:TonB family protein [Burkholderia cepacia]
MPILTTPHPSSRAVVIPPPTREVTRPPPESSSPPAQRQPDAAPVITRAAPPTLALPAGSAIKGIAHVACNIAQPSYPPRARRLGHEGTVLLRVTVDPTGRIIQADVTRSSGFSELDDVARQTVLAGHCSPYLENDLGVAVHAEQAIAFRLDQLND